jgi:hypothetical protein
LGSIGRSDARVNHIYKKVNVLSPAADQDGIFMTMNKLDRPRLSYYTNCIDLLNIQDTRRRRRVPGTRKTFMAAVMTYGFEFGKEPYQNDD